jgi:MFS family permease
MATARRLVRVVGMATIFVALGPLLASFAFALATLSDLSGFDKAFVILSYTLGVVPAFIAGLAVGAADRLGRLSRALVVLIVGLAVGAVLAVFMAGLRGADRIEGNSVALILSCVFATFACWGIARMCYRQASSNVRAAP